MRVIPAGPFHKEWLYGAGEEERGKGDQDGEEVQSDRSGRQPKLQRRNEQRDCDQAQTQQRRLAQEKIADHQRTNNDERSQQLVALDLLPEEVSGLCSEQDYRRPHTCTSGIDARGPDSLPRALAKRCCAIVQVSSH